MKENTDIWGPEISKKVKDGVNYISLTDIAKFYNSDSPDDVVIFWMSYRDSFYLYSLWEELYNADFNSAESGRIKTDEVGSNAFYMTPSQWKKRTNAKGIIPGSGRSGGGTFAHPDLAMDFSCWMDPAFKLRVIGEYQKMRENELARTQ